MKLFGGLIVLSVLVFSCRHTPNPSPKDEEGENVRFAVIGDFGDFHEGNVAVANLVKSWSPEFIVTTGDNNYAVGNKDSFNKNIGRQYCDFIYNPNAPESVRCNGYAAEEQLNRFFPSFGNHDLWGLNDSIDYHDYFDLPGDELYYDVRWGSTHFFLLNSNDLSIKECCENEQAIWLKEQLAASTARYKLIVFHHPPFSPARHGNNPKMNWPYREWGATAVLAGHDHVYATVIEKAHPNFVYFINGLGGNRNKYVCDAHPMDTAMYDVKCYNQAHGAMLVEADSTELTLSFISVDNPESKIDEIKIKSEK